MTSIGFIGLGRMGAGMAARLITDGWRLPSTTCLTRP